MFADYAKIYVRSGKGGDGHVSFRREKYVPDGGPDGGDGGRGGSVIFAVDTGLNTLTDFRHVRKYAAQDGECGGKRNRAGKSGKDIIVKFPLGTVIREELTGKVVADMSDPSMSIVVLTGGRGGNGNQHYATSTMQAPHYAQPGQEAIELNLILELKVIAEVGLVGYPNVGKSTLLSRTSNARPKIANYHFTTLHPHLGVVDVGDGVSFVMADIPGLIEGAAEGAGLGHNFLRHVERTKVLVHVVDVAGTEGRDPVQDIITINNELERYNPELMHRPMVIAANKIDLSSDEAIDNIARLRKEFESDNIKVFPISAVSGEGVKQLLFYINNLLENMEESVKIYEPDFILDEYYIETQPFDVVYDQKRGEYVVEGPRIDKMLGYTNLESEKGYAFFQDFLKKSGVDQALVQAGIEDGDTVRMYGHSFTYYK